MRTRISNEYVIIEIDPLGAELKRIFRSDLNIEYLWPGDPNSWNRSAPTLFPIVGKLKDDYYLHGGKQYSVKQHGFARDMKFDLVEYNGTSAQFELSSDNVSRDRYPWDFSLSIKYTLRDNKLVVEQTIKNKSQDLMYYSIGAHPAFRWPLDQHRQKEDYSIEFKNDTNLERTILDNGLLSDNTEHIDLSAGRMKLSDQLFANDALVFDNFKSSEVSYKEANSENGLTVGWTDCPFLGIWSKQDANFICIEPWQGIADHISHDHRIANKKGIRALEPGSEGLFSWWIRVY